jgi:hypothetical protein
MKSMFKKMLGLTVSTALFLSFAIPVSASTSITQNVPNSGFESGNWDGWRANTNASNGNATYFEVSSERVKEGSYSLKVVDPSQSDGVSMMSDYIEVIPGERYKGSAWIWNPNDGASRSSIIGQYYDADKKPLIANVPAFHQQTRGSWVLSEVDLGIAPANAKYMSIGPSLSNLWTTSGSFYDNFQVTGVFPQIAAVGAYTLSANDFVNMNETYELTLKASSAIDLYAIVADISFDPTMFNFVNVELIGQFANGIVTTAQEVGKVSFIATLTGATGITGDTDVAKLTFNTFVSGQSDFTLLTSSYSAKSNADVTGDIFNLQTPVSKQVTVVKVVYDVNGDGLINLVDLTTVAYYVGTNVTAATAKYDLNADGVIDIEDLGVLATEIFNN